MKPRAKPLYVIISWIIMLMIPFILVMASVRAIMNPPFLNLEYQTPGFPTDSYGFTLQERIKWASYALNFAWNGANVSYLGDLRFSDGTPVYNERELSHMVDVQHLAQIMMKIWYAMLALLLVFGIWAWRSHWWRQFRRGIWQGGWFTVAIVVAIVVFLVTNFNLLFTDFHHLFFQGNSWLFSYSDTLIRVFPLRFWQDIFIFIGGLCLIVGLILGLTLGERKSSPEEKKDLLQSA